MSATNRDPAHVPCRLRSRWRLPRLLLLRLAGAAVLGLLFGALAAAPAPAAGGPSWVALGPAGGPVTAVAAAATASGVVYAGTAFAGVFRS
ncbi:MAG TPA: hypothetical protein VN999_01455, partial [Thermoanaerobaculia bacterium]|nr:hypothetical protein [Thermoanaerobaculia bacterium]